MEDMKSEKKRANIENAQPLKYYPITLRAFYRKRLRPAYSEVVPSCQKPARNERPSPGHCITAQNPRVSTLYAARQHSVPPPNLLGRFKFEKLRFLSRKCLKRANGFFCYVAMPFKRKRTKSKRVQPLPSAAVEYWMLDILPPGPKLCDFAGFVLASRIRPRIG